MSNVCLALMGRVGYGETGGFEELVNVRHRYCITG